jgi:ABC-type glycerol-3-phosphate transport system substrate-binding protein
MTKNGQFTLDEILSQPDVWEDVLDFFMSYQPPLLVAISRSGTTTETVQDDFTTANPNISVNVTVSDWDTYWDKLQTTLAGGNPPDVFAMDAPLYPDYQSRDVLMNLQPMIDRDGFDLTA